MKEKNINIEKNLIFYGIELNELSIKKLELFNETKYVNWIRNHRKFRKFQKSEDNEKLLIEKSITIHQHGLNFLIQSMARLKFNLNGKILTETQILDLLSSTDGKVRKEAAKVFGETLKENIFFSFIMNTISKDLDIDKNIRVLSSRIIKTFVKSNRKVRC